MSKAQDTRLKILQQASELFNQQGYAGSSISDVMRVTGLQKGGIYNHFKSKDELALEAFDFAIQKLGQLHLQALREQRHAIDRLHAMIGVISRSAINPPIPGGCPLMNTAIESDDAHPALRAKAQAAMDSWRRLIQHIVERGITRGEICPSVNIEAIATIIISTLEGAVMMSNLYGDPIHIQYAIEHLTDHLTRSLSLQPVNLPHSNQSD